MRITKTSDRVAAFNNAKRVANIGCDTCPCCGETKQSIDYFIAGEFNKGIVSGIQKTWAQGFFKMKSMKCDCYNCLTCGAKWESEPYEW